MNERIQKLAEQAGFRSDVTVTDGNNKRIDTKTSIALEKFAELIVRECINVSEAHAKSLEAQPSDPILEEYEVGIVSGIYEATTAIKQHFGVEE